MNLTRTDAGLTLTRTLNAPRERVWRAWTDAEQMKKWFSPPGFTTPHADVDLRIGGAYRIVMRAPDGVDNVAVGMFRVIEPPARLAYTWNWEDPASNVGDTLVTIELRDAGARTELVLIHERLPGKEAVDLHADGWVGCISSLESHLA